MTTQFDPVAFRRQIFFWLIALAVFIVFLLVFRSILLPFVAGMALAYFLDPVADWFERRGFSRLMATLAILTAFVGVFAVTLIVLIPVLVTQAADLGGRIPGYITQLQSLLMADSNLLPGWISGQLGQIKESFAALLKEGAGLVGTIFQQIWNSGMALLDIAALFVVTPVVAFYLLLDWDNMIEKVDRWIPRDHVGTVRNLASQIDQAIAGFVRGQGSVCLILGLIYAVGLSIVGLNFGLLIGIFAGLISFIPYVGSLVGLVLALIVAIVQFWPDFIMIGAVVGVFAAGQFFEGNILQPRLVGSSVGLHPVWLMFALFAFGALFGFVGMMIAVPAAASVGVLVRFAISRYLDSDLYHGRQRPLDPAAVPTDEAPGK
ncbi:AI-2E family transporter [Hoeflea sp. YIM 152468]|uniref:AI-2E family transporter n=1 Tax=Hoeflea sp. YIM 152468 TaxID=3031759 RepID=UPI0023DC6C59|nr:AI-2E family transporter [Hoeflea sp. YIM 152468]MDF1607186.1 AI-2E family transporter [Hoeflea sp. YIM 152468]